MGSHKQDKSLLFDSLPDLLCQKMRNKRAKIFPELANLGHTQLRPCTFCDFKTHPEITIKGYILNHDVILVSVYDTQVTTTLVEGCPFFRM